jgi:ABC-type antimicrobial peptide transport system permease subunit
MTPLHENGWSEYEKLVLFRLDQQDVAIKDLTKIVQSLKTSMAITKLKLAFIGVVSGTIGSAIVYAFAASRIHP